LPANPDIIENMTMRIVKILGLIAFLVSGPSRAEPVVPERDAEAFRALVERLNARYENFFVRDEEIKKYYEQIRSGIGAHKSKRQMEIEAAQEARRQFKREPPADNSELEAAHEAKLRADALEFDKYRQAYVEQRRQLAKISESARKVPENRDSGLESSNISKP
jgi:hypothetical protein